MNAVEIEAAISELALQPFDRSEFPFAFLTAFGNKDIAVKRLRAGNNNTSDLPGGVLQRSKIHMATCDAGEVGATLIALRASPATTKAKAAYILATDGQTLEAEELANGETIACAYPDIADHFGFFLPLAGISTIKEIKDNPIDIRATGRLNKLYVELLRENPDWATAARRVDMNHFMARLVFCFFAEDTNIFLGEGTFTQTVRQYSEPGGGNTNEVLSHLFLAMNTPTRHDGMLDDRYRKAALIRPWADGLPYVNGGLFSGSTDVPRFTRMARTYLLHTGALKWREINPDIFGSMIQAVADDEERGALGMHYTSVPNILKVLNPLFLDDLRTQLEAATDNKAKLLNLRKRMARIRVFDPACGSGNFLVIAYKQMRGIEAIINKRRGESELGSEIPLTNFRGIELRDFPAEIARLALIIAEFQSDVLYRGQKDALLEFLPLDKQNWIVCGNALQLDWFQLMDADRTGVKLQSDDLFQTPLIQTQINFEHSEGETFICGNPPYLGSKWQSENQKAELGAIFKGRVKNWKSLDYVAGWFIKASDYGAATQATTAFVSTNSICQGQQVPILWPLIFKLGIQIVFAHTSFKWANLASHNAGVTVVIVGISGSAGLAKRLYSVASDDSDQVVERRDIPNINAYLVPAPNVEVQQSAKPMQNLSLMQFGNHPYYGAALIFTIYDARQMVHESPNVARYIRPLYGSREFINATPRACLWITADDARSAADIPSVAVRLAAVAQQRLNAKQDSAAQKLATTPYRFRDLTTANNHLFVVPRVSSESRPYLPIGILDERSILQDAAFGMYDAPLWNMALIASRIHLVWIATVCGKLETRYRYSNTLGWNTFPVPQLTEQNKADLTACAENILLAREAHFPDTIADLYAPTTDEGGMPDNLRAAHEHNDEVLERIYIGRRFKNDTERLEKLFELYTKMTAAAAKVKTAAKTVRRKKTA